MVTYNRTYWGHVEVIAVKYFVLGVSGFLGSLIQNCQPVVNWEAGELEFVRNFWIASIDSLFLYFKSLPPFLMRTNMGNCQWRCNVIVSGQSVVENELVLFYERGRQLSISICSHLSAVLPCATTTSVCCSTCVSVGIIRPQDAGVNGRRMVNGRQI